MDLNPGQTRGSVSSPSTPHQNDSPSPQAFFPRLIRKRVGLACIFTSVSLFTGICSVELIDLR